MGAHAHHADPVDLGAQSDLICAPEPMSIEAVLADQLAARLPCSSVI
jgi:hypothetical protein